MNLYRFIFMGTLVLASPVLAGDLESILACADVENDIARLECFDKAASELLERAADSGVEVSKDTSNSEAGGEPVETAGAADDQPNGGHRPTSPSSIVEADESMVADCEFLGTVVGKSGWGGMAASRGARGAIQSAKKRAAKLGATHIIIGDFETGQGMKLSTSRGRAYYCPNS